MKDMVTTDESVSIQKGVLVALDQITVCDDFCFRHYALDRHHTADLASTIKNTGKALAPVRLWQPNDGSGMLALLDGRHRLAAYHAAKWNEPIPATILTCNRRMALQSALSGNARRELQLTQAERMDAAWRLVREPVTPIYTVREVVRAASVSTRTVKYMRKRHRVMHEEGIEITGSWARDRNSADYDHHVDVMSDARRKAEIRKLAGDIRDLLDRRKHRDRLILMDSQAVDEAIYEALGDYRLKGIISYFFGSAEDADEWWAFAEEADEHADADDEEQEEDLDEDTPF